MIVAWQGWRIEVPDRWGPVKVEGDADEGHLLMADMVRPRLGVRWKKESSKRFKPEAAVLRAMAKETGESGSDRFAVRTPEKGQWQSPLLYEDREPPGRDVWVGYSQESSRLFQVVYHAHHRDAVLTQKVLPTLLDSAADTPREWSIFELSCKTPAPLVLAKHRLNAGDLSLWFTGPRGQAATVRQIAVAKLALQRRPLVRWIAEQAAWRGRYFKTAGEPVEAGNDLFRQQIVRRRRFVWMLWMARGYAVVALHDKMHDRLVVVDATDESLARELMDSVGWARGL